MEGRWERTHEAYGREAALNAVDGGAAWAFLWCGGGVSRSTDASDKRDAVGYARSHLIEPRERDRLFAKAQRKHRTKTVVMAERWTNESGQELIVFYEDGPYLLPDRESPDAV